MARRDEVVLVIPDLHIPYQHPQAFSFLARIKKQYSPNLVICTGDEIDAHPFSRYDPDPDGNSPERELALAVKQLRRLYKIFPSARVCESNHVQRIYRKAFAAGLPKRCIRSEAEILEAPKGWTWRRHWEHNGVIYQHGDGYAGASAAVKAATLNRCSTVIGHVHSHAGIKWMTSVASTIFGFNVGCLIDPDAIAFQYAKHQAARPTLGCGVIVNGVPRFEPLCL